MYDEPLFLAAGDGALVVELGDSIDPETNRKVHNLLRSVERRSVPGVIDLVPTYRSLLVEFDPIETPLEELKSILDQCSNNLDELDEDKRRVVHIPTLYSGEYAPDLPFVAEHAGLTIDEVVSIHSGTDYLVYMMGFTPGFAYLGGLSEKVATPRLETPRTVTPGGSVGIAESQTGVYPVASPGGWRLIGRTPVRLFDPQREPPAVLAAGDYVRFVPLSGEAEYLRILDRVKTANYECTVETES